MIMPCMNSTSARDTGGRVAFVDGGSVLLGFPGAPGCTTTGFVAESVCCAGTAEDMKPVKALAVTSMPNTARTVRAVWRLVLRCPRQSIHFGAYSGIFGLLSYHEALARVG